jgi:hypothetical protein
LLLLTDAFVIEHILPNLPLDKSMMWRLRWVNHVWHKVVDESLEWHALNIVKYHNVFYLHTIVTQGFPRHFWNNICNLKFIVESFAFYMMQTFETLVWRLGLKLHVFFWFCNSINFDILKDFLCIKVFTYSWNLNFWFTLRMTSNFQWIWCVWILELS